MFVICVDDTFTTFTEIRFTHNIEMYGNTFPYFDYFKYISQLTSKNNTSNKKYRSPFGKTKDSISSQEHIQWFSDLKSCRKLLNSVIAPSPYISIP